MDSTVESRQEAVDGERRAGAAKDLETGIEPRVTTSTVVLYVRALTMCRRFIYLFFASEWVSCSSCKIFFFKCKFV